MCDASDFAVEAVLGQRIDGKSKPIYYANNTLNNEQEHYTTTEKELLVVVFSFDKFRPYLVLSKTIVYIDHSALKGDENLAADHLSRLENPDLGTFMEEEIADEFPDKRLMVLKTELNNDEPCASVTGRKVYESGFFWPSIFKDAKDYMMRCDACQRSGNISSRSEMPQNNIQVEAQALPMNDARVVIKFLRRLFTRFGVPKALISDRGTHFCNSQLEKALQKYGVTHKLSIAYHPQTNGQTEVTNKAIKHILKRSVGYNLKNWSEKLDDALWAFRTAYKTPIGCTPFRLVYGKALATKNRFMELNKLIEIRDGAYENTQIYKERTKRWHDSRLRGDKNFKVRDMVFRIWRAFGGNTHDFGSFGEETNEIMDLHQILEEILLTGRGDGVTSIKQCRLNPSSDGVRDLVTTSGHGRLNEDLESSTNLCLRIHSPATYAWRYRTLHITEPRSGAPSSISHSTPKYVAPSDDEIPVEDQPLPTDASPTALSPGYVADYDPSEDDPEEDPADYLADKGDDEEEEESSEDDDDDEEEEASEEDEDKEEEHLAPADSAALPVIDLVPLAEETESFETDESAATPPPPRLPQTKLRAASPLPIPSPPLLLPSADRRSDIPETDMSFRKRLCLTAPASRFKVGESSTVAVARQTVPTLAHRVDYEFINTMDASIRAAKSRVMTAVEEVNEMVTDLATTQSVLQRQKIDDVDRLTMHIQHEYDRFRELARTRDARHQDGPADASSSSQGVTDALAEHEANRNSRNGDDSHDLGSGGRR
ncbi:reverse transcriptase domain-containing protein [Tanacetum coccineum]